MGRIVCRTVDDLCRRGLNLRVECARCKRAIVLDRHQLRRWQQVFRWAVMLEWIAAKFPCRHCGDAPIVWGMMPPGDGRDLLNLDAISRARRDRLLARVRFWHALAQGRMPAESYAERGRRRR